MTKNEILRELREQDELLKKIFDRRKNWQNSRANTTTRFGKSCILMVKTIMIFNLKGE